MAVAFHEPGHGAALDADAGTDEGHLVGQVQETPGPEPLPHLQLGRGLEQEDPLGASLADHFVHRGVFGVDAAQVRPAPLPLLHQVQGLLQLVQDRQGEQVDLGEVGIGHAVLVPVHDVPAVGGPGPDGDHFRYRGTAQHHAAHVLAQAAGRSHQLGGQLHQVPPPRRLHPVAEEGQGQHLPFQVGGVVGVELAGEPLQVLLGQPQGLAQVLDDALHRVGADGPGQDGVLRPETPVHPPDEFVPEGPGEVQVDVG